jgi:hypothetical protein
MEPLSALSIATAVVQFLDFAGSILSSTYKIYTSSPGDLGQNNDVRSITKSLIDLNTKLEADLNYPTPGRLSSQDKYISQLGRECNEIGNRLVLALERIQAQQKNGLWGSFRLALATVWSRGDIESLQQTMSNYRQQISMHILVALRYVRSRRPHTKFLQFIL